ncbi:GGDEF domain-containing protein [Vibrio lamellibrachiae]|uniref:GGDEF domain-containing protein n=1 Tax=Vibrio lamellibrachiae TaxID=2910253 RepID=UPI003D0DF84C
MSVEQKILQMVVEITEQTNSISLAHCVTATLAEMVPIQSVHLVHYSGETSHLIAAITREENNHGQASYHWLPTEEKPISADFDHNMSSSMIKDSGTGLFHCIFPICIDEHTSARFIVVMAQRPNEFQLLIEGFSQIYKNYLIVLRDSERDELTGLMNRKVMEQKLTQSFESSVEGQFDDEYSPRVALVDIDKFKAVNDTFGHLIGDEVLLIFSQQMQQFFNHEEQLFRFGGEEFVVLFPRTKLDDAEKRMEDFRQHIEQYRFPQVSQVTFSGGICSIQSTDFVPSILDHADKALYYAKDNGRNRVCSYQRLKDEGVFADDDISDSDAELF